MFFGWRKRKRFERGSSLELPPGQWERAWSNLRRRDVLGRIGLALGASAILCVVIRGWDPPFAYRVGYCPPRDIVAAVSFSKFDPAATELAKQRAREDTRYVYAQDAAPLVRLRAELRNTLVELTAAPTLDKLDPKIWREFGLPLAEGEKRPDAATRAEQFLEFRAAFTPQESLERMDAAIAEVFRPFERRGLLDKLDQTLGSGNQNEITVYTADRPNQREHVRIIDVLIGDGSAMRDALRKNPDLSAVTDRLFAWLKPRLKPTLSVDLTATKEAIDRSVAAVPDTWVTYPAEQALAKAGESLTLEHIDLLRLEYAASMKQRPMVHRIARGTAITGVIFTAMLLCGIHMRYRQRGPLASLTRLVVLLMLSSATVMVARWASADAWRGELAPVLLFGMIMAIVYRQELALLLVGATSLIVVLAIGHRLPEFLLLMGASTAAILNLGRIRSRS